MLTTVGNKAQKYKADQREFVNKFIDDLERIGFVRKNPRAQWAAASLLVPKDSKTKFRMTVDLRAMQSTQLLKQCRGPCHILTLRSTI